jgi:putative cardiolipin synthase
MSESKIKFCGLATALLAAAFVLSACSSLRPDFVKTPSTALTPDLETPAGHYINAQLQQHKDQSGFRLLNRSTQALMSRISLADHATKSIDLQYYIFQNDAVGRLVAQRVLAAADRGVRVRMLLDDISLNDEDRLLAALDAHPNIEVRLFNPFRTRSPSLPSKIAQFVIEGERLNHRMHNKAFIVDGTAAIVGGRNIGNAYFDADDQTNFRDLDVLAIGPVVAQASRSFDNYWNSDAAYPVAAFRQSHNAPADLVSARETLKHDAREFAQSDYVQEALEESPHAAVDDGRIGWYWGSAVLVADEPEKVELKHDEPALRIGPKVKTILDAATREILLMSPYFVPGKSGTNYLTARAKQGIKVQVLTNSLAATDEPAAHSGYAQYRRDLLEGGVQLYELRPDPGEPQRATAGGTSSGVSLHAKAAVVDERYVFVGSMNMDQRSKLLNTEMGVIVDCPELALKLAEFFAKATQPAVAFHVTLKPTSGRAPLQWSAENNGTVQTFDAEPGATKARRIEVTLFRLLPIEGLL